MRWLHPMEMAGQVECKWVVKSVQLPISSFLERGELVPILEHVRVQRCNLGHIPTDQAAKRPVEAFPGLADCAFR